MAIDKYREEELDRNETLLNGFLIAVYLLSLAALLMSVSGSSFGDTVVRERSEIKISDFIGIDAFEASDALLKNVTGKGIDSDSSQAIQKVILWDEGNKTKKGLTTSPTYTNRHSIKTTATRY